MKSGKREAAEGIEQQNQETHWSEWNFLYLELLEVDTIKQAEIKEQIR